jgi:hypothetical protein
MDQYPIINRSAIVVIPPEPFLKWVNSLDSGLPRDDAPPLTLAHIQRENNIYLLPTFERAKDIEQAVVDYIKENFDYIFLNELEGWDLDGDTYPSLDYETFTKWFKVTFHAMIYDIMDKPIKREKY